MKIAFVRIFVVGFALVAIASARAEVTYAGKGLFGGRVTITGKAPNTTYTIFQTVRARGGAYVATPHTITTDGAGNGSIYINNNDATPLTKHRLIAIGTGATPNSQPPEIVVVARGIFGPQLYASFTPGMNSPLTCTLYNTVATNEGDYVQTWQPGAKISILLNPAEAQWQNMGAQITTTGDLQAQIINIGPAAITVQIVSDPTPLTNDEIQISGIGVNCLMGLNSRFPIRTAVQGPTSDFVGGTFMGNQNFPNQVESPYDSAVVTSAGTILPDSVSVIQGDLFQGDTDELLFSDGMAVEVFSNSVNLNTEFEVVGQRKGPINNFLDLAVEFSIDRSGMVVQITALHMNGNYVPVDGRVAPTSNMALNIPLGLNFVPADGVVRARVQFAPINDEDPSQDGWLARIEKLRWMSG